jgi:hypothetical protein
MSSTIVKVSASIFVAFFNKTCHKLMQFAFPDWDQLIGGLQGYRPWLTIVVLTSYCDNWNYSDNTWLSESRCVELQVWMRFADYDTKFCLFMCAYLCLVLTQIEVKPFMESAVTVLCGVLTSVKISSDCGSMISHSSIGFLQQDISEPFKASIYGL